MLFGKINLVLWITLGLSCTFGMGCQPRTIPETVASPSNSPISNSSEVMTSPIEYLGELKIPTGFIFQDTQLGGLSGITYDSERNLYYALSDDRAIQGPARFYTLEIDLNPLVVTPIGVTALVDQSSRPFPTYSVDPEGIALTRRDTLFISSEGDVERGIQPFIKEFSREGKELQSLPISDKFLSQNGQGIRNNLAFESLTLSPNKQFLYTATESALVQDGEPANLEKGTVIRILQYDLTTTQSTKEFYYLTEPVQTEPNYPDGFTIHGLVELLAWNETKLLSLERGFTEDVGTSVLLYEISLEGTTNIQSVESLNNLDLGNIQPVQKRLLLDLSTLDIPLDNLEGMTFGPELADGGRSLILVSDNNFNPLQVTQFIVFALTLEE
ncbi:esterase-like activity of phytase family protein [Phormidium pseudopriestleyi FRX01]|uniref:Esterase-like activity of phytase family protein n=1 Tax=Phormidium pseudopriestleyi FRX01 TaxID=1759528 RepID=A0ABS3FSD3_9CYAN|nr:esterase-like activity of phytase family protein [Phormidium pseudopriestleyi]MBO0350000.1 esterase-like activity of phytase family protein [Phormidium pseudopriestleyi FRX01]